MGGLQARAMGRYEQKVAEQNASLEREQINFEQENTRREALDHYRRVAQIKGQQRLAAAAGGVSTDFGTAATIVEETDALGRADADLIYRRGHQAVRGLDRSVGNYVAEGRAARSRGKAAFTKSLFDAGSTVLSGVQQYQTLGKA